MHAVISLNDQTFQPLADVTWTLNKVPYCKKHGYRAINKTTGFYGNISIGFEKIFFIRDLMAAQPDIEWIWWTGCDAMITNHSIRIEDKIDAAYDMIIATDCNGINSDSFLIKNSEWGRAYIQYIIDVMPQYENHYFYEQQAIIESFKLHPNNIKVVPQRYLNSYDYKLYPTQSNLDHLGTDGSWSYGDWLIHWPGTSLDARLYLSRHYLTLITP